MTVADDCMVAEVNGKLPHDVAQAPLKLNIGAGHTVIPGYTPVDRMFGQEAYPLAYDDNIAETIRASHVLEHFGWAEIDAVLADWVRVLKPGGEIYISVPDFAKAVKLAEDNTDPKWPYYIMGGQTDANDFHKVIFTEAFLSDCMRRAGLTSIHQWTSQNTDTAAHPVSLNLMGTKPAVVRTRQAPRPVANIRALFSMPRLGFTDNFFTANRVFVQRGIDMHRYQGVFWDQCMERMLQDAINEGCEFAVTLDYDSVFDGEAFDELLRLIQENPEVDVIAPLQIKREGETPLIWDTDRDGVPLTTLKLDGELTRIKHAHFGLTVFRLSSLAAIPHPWFQGHPNMDGEWGDGRMDPDIHFWEKLDAFHVKLFLANRVSIGHLQLMATWPKKGGGVFHQHATDFGQRGAPKEVLWT